MLSQELGSVAGIPLLCCFPPLPSPLFYSHAGLAFLSLSFMCHIRPRGDRTKVGYSCFPGRGLESWGMDRQGRTSDQSLKWRNALDWCTVHLRIPWIFLAFWKCKQHVSFICPQTFCCQLDELIHWLYNIADVTDHWTPPKSSLTGLKSSLQLYRVKLMRRG